MLSEIIFYEKEEILKVYQDPCERNRCIIKRAG